MSIPIPTRRAVTSDPLARAHSTQRRVWGNASKRSGGMGFRHTSHKRWPTVHRLPSPVGRRPGTGVTAHSMISRPARPGAPGPTDTILVVFRHRSRRFLQTVTPKAVRPGPGTGPGDYW